MQIEQRKAGWAGEPDGGLRDWSSVGIAPGVSLPSRLASPRDERFLPGHSQRGEVGGSEK